MIDVACGHIDPDLVNAQPVSDGVVDSLRFQFLAARTDGTARLLMRLLVKA